MFSRITSHYDNYITQFSPRWQIAVKLSWLTAALSIAVLITAVIVSAQDPTNNYRFSTADEVDQQSADRDRQQLDVLTAEHSPWPAGAQIWFRDTEVEGHSCSVAFSLTSITHSLGYAVTAAHCGAVGDTVWGKDGSAVGEVVATGDEVDWSLVRITSSSTVTRPGATGASTSPQPKGQSLLTEPLHGMVPVTLRGATSAVEHGHLDTSNSHQSNGGETSPTTACGRPGDSGGAVLASSDSGEIVVGVISTGDERCGQTDSDGRIHPGAGIAMAETLSAGILEHVPEAIFHRGTVVL